MEKLKQQQHETKPNNKKQQKTTQIKTRKEDTPPFGCI